MSTLPERLQDVIVEFRRIAKDHEIKADRPHQDDSTRQWHMGTAEAYDDAADRLEAAQSLQAQEVVKETTINHARDPHCCGCYVIRWNDGDPVAVCGECGVQVALLDRLVAQEGGGIDEGMMIRACTAYNEVIPLSGFDSQRPLAMRAALTAALQAPTP